MYFMKIRLVTIVFLAALAAGSAFAHGNKVHVSGTIEKVSSESIVVKTRDGKSVEVKLVAATTYISHVANKAANPSDASQDKPAKLADLVVGDLVVVHATPKNGGLEADEVKFSQPASMKPATATDKPKSSN